MNISKREHERIEKLVEEKGEKAKIFGTQTKAQGKKRNTPLASTSEKPPESATLDAVSLFTWSRTGMTHSRCSKNLEHFLLFPPLHYSTVIQHFPLFCPNTYE